MNRLFGRCLGSQTSRKQKKLNFEPNSSGGAAADPMINSLSSPSLSNITFGR
jgi:hypothetical protein